MKPGQLLVAVLCDSWWHWDAQVSLGPFAARMQSGGRRVCSKELSVETISNRNGEHMC